MRMSKTQRAQVVELLRCAADLGMSGVVAPLSEAIARVGTRTSPLEYVADNAVDAVAKELEIPWWDRDGWSDYASHCLEAALRVELGEWPTPPKKAGRG